MAETSLPLWIPNSSSTKPQDCQKVTLETNKDADKDNVDKKLLCVSDSLSHRLKPNEVFVKNNKTVKLAKSGDTAAGVIGYNYMMRFIGYDSIQTRWIISHRFQIRTIT